MNKDFFSNFCFAINLCWRYDKKLFVLKFLQILVNWTLAFSPIFLTRELLNAISENISVKEVLLRGLFFFFLVFVSRFFSDLIEYLIETQNKYLEKKYMDAFCQKAMNVRYDQLETASFRDVMELADSGQNVFKYIDYVFEFLRILANIGSCIAVIVQLKLIIALISVVPCIVKGIISLFTNR